MPKYHCIFAQYQHLKILKWAQNWAALKTFWVWAQGLAKIERERERKFSCWARARAQSNFLSALKLWLQTFSKASAICCMKSMISTKISTMDKSLNISKKSNDSNRFHTAQNSQIQWYMTRAYGKRCHFYSIDFSTSNNLVNILWPLSLWTLSF